MGDIEQLIANLRTIYANLALLRQVEGPELLVAGHAEQTRQQEYAMLIAYRQLESSIDELDQQVEEERYRIDVALQQYGEPREAEIMHVKASVGFDSRCHETTEGADGCVARMKVW